MQVFIGAKQLTHHLDHSSKPPKKPEAFADGAESEVKKKCEDESKAYVDWVLG